MNEMRLSKEIYGKLIDITTALYRVTCVFPKGEVLTIKLREKSNEIVERIIEYGFSDIPEKEVKIILAKIDTIKEYLEIAGIMNFTNLVNCHVLTREYDSLVDFFTDNLEELKAVKKTADDQIKEKPVQKTDNFAWNEFSATTTAKKAVQEARPVRISSDEVNERQKAILDHFKQVKEAKISDFFQFFNEVSSKTIQRDLQDLVVKNYLNKEGEKRWTTYSLKSNNVF